MSAQLRICCVLILAGDAQLLLPSGPCVGSRTGGRGRGGRGESGAGSEDRRLGRGARDRRLLSVFLE